MINDRHNPSHYEQITKDSCRYCHRPAMWLQVGNEKVCAHCGTRVYSPSMTFATNSITGKRDDR